MSAEDRLIARFFQPLATHPGALGLSDDAAFLTPPPGCDLVLKTDAIVGGVHFFPEDAAHSVAGKALRVNLSDLAAKGARPLGFLLSLALPKDVGDEWLEGFAQGLRGDSVLFSCPLFGGDTDRTPGPITVSIAMFGAVPEGTMVRRAGAKAGDHVFVSGTIGDATLGLMMRKGKDWNLAEEQRQHLVSRYCCHSREMRWPRLCAPTPRRQWTFPMVLSGIFPSSAARLVWQPYRRATYSSLGCGQSGGRCRTRGHRFRPYRRRRLRDCLHRAAGQGGQFPHGSPGKWTWRLPRSVKSRRARALGFWPATAALLRSSGRLSVTFETGRTCQRAAIMKSKNGTSPCTT